MMPLVFILGRKAAVFAIHLSKFYRLRQPKADVPGKHREATPWRPGKTIGPLTILKSAPEVVAKSIERFLIGNVVQKFVPSDGFTSG